MPLNSPPEHIPGFKYRATPWLAVNPNYTSINAAQETADPNSVYNYTRQLIALRAKTPAFVYGDFKDLDPNHPQIFLYTRTLNGDQYLVIHNFSSQPFDYTLPDNIKAGTMLLANYPSHENSSTILHLKGWESRIYKQ